MTGIEDYGTRSESFRLRLLERDMDAAEKEGLAMQAALSEHAVVSYIRRLPAEPTSYPAIEYLTLAEQKGTSKSKQKSSAKEGKEENTDVQEADRGHQERNTEDSISDQEENRKGSRGDDREENDTDDQGTNAQDRNQYRYREFIEWCMPAHDHNRPKEKGCGFIRSKTGNGLVYSACPNDTEHYIKGKRRHCWSLRCPQCMNDTALKRGISIEKQLLLYRGLSRKKGGTVGEIGHWVVSPPQEYAKRMVQTREEFDMLCRYVDDSLMADGASAGVTIFHPWRQKEDEWEFSPHFHALCYGFIDTRQFKRDNPGWIIKKVHSREKIRSIRHTAAYLTTHMGLGLSEKDPSDTDWDMRILDRMIPGILSSGADYTEEDHRKHSEGKGRMVGDLSGTDWVQWTKDQLCTEFKIRYWGGASKSNIRPIANLRQYKIRVCKECGELLRTYDGLDDGTGSYVRYIQDNPVVAFAADIEMARLVFQQYKATLRAEGMTVADLAKMTPFAMCTLELDLPKNKDIIMDGPFEEPDEYFLRRQKAAFGEDTQT